MKRSWRALMSISLILKSRRCLMESSHQLNMLSFSRILLWRILQNRPLFLTHSSRSHKRRGLFMTMTTRMINLSLSLRWKRWFSPKFPKSPKSPNLLLFSLRSLRMISFLLFLLRFLRMISFLLKSVSINFFLWNVSYSWWSNLTQWLQWCSDWKI